MTIASPGQIYLANQRGVAETEGLTRWSTFNYTDYFEESRQPFGSLITFNDEVFAPEGSEVYQVGRGVWAVIIPVTGEVICKDNRGYDQVIDVGQALLYTQTGNTITLTNPYKEDKINFLYLEFAADNITTPLLPQILNFDFENKLNALIPIANNKILTLPFALHIGMFKGRGETLYQLQNKGAKFFAFVIAGAFELQGRLLHQRDGLALWNLHGADMEALSNNAVILIIEIYK